MYKASYDHVQYEKQGPGANHIDLESSYLFTYGRFELNKETRIFKSQNFTVRATRYLGDQPGYLALQRQQFQCRGLKGFSQSQMSSRVGIQPRHEDSRTQVQYPCRGAPPGVTFQCVLQPECLCPSRFSCGNPNAQSDVLGCGTCGWVGPS